MGKYLGGRKQLKEMDSEWVLLMKEAKRLNIKKEEIRIFLERKKEEQNTVNK